MVEVTHVDHDRVAQRRAEIQTRLDAMRERIASIGERPVEILGVTKGQPFETVCAAIALGIPLGESYAQELAEKASSLEAAGLDQPEWHFIGQLQTNKVRKIADRVRLWQSIDRARVATEVARRAPGARVFVQVNLSGQTGKGGCTFEQLDDLVGHVEGLDLRLEGLMGVGTEGDLSRTADGFRLLRSEVDRLGLAHCSMGMTDDLELAVEHGSTMVRVGTALFGPRSPRPG